MFSLGFHELMDGCEQAKAGISKSEFVRSFGFALNVCFISTFAQRPLDYFTWKADRPYSYHHTQGVHGIMPDTGFAKKGQGLPEQMPRGAGPWISPLGEGRPCCVTCATRYLPPFAMLWYVHTKKPLFFLLHWENLKVKPFLLTFTRIHWNTKCRGKCARKCKTLSGRNRICKPTFQPPLSNGSSMNKY